MLKNLFKVAIRNIFKDLGYSGLNILGLTLGIASALLLILYIADELSYDRYHKNSERIYRVVSHISEPDDAFDWIVAQIPFAPQVKQDYPEVEECVRLITHGRALFEQGDLKFFEEDVFYADSGIFKVFDYPLIQGEPSKALAEPNSIVITRSFASRYFPNQDPMGQSLKREDKLLKVTGIMEDVPKNSHIRFDALVSRTTLPNEIGSWGNFGVYTYLLLPEDLDVHPFEKKINGMYDKYMAEIFERRGIQIRYSLQPITRIHLHSTYQGEPEPTGSIIYVYIFGIVAFFLILIASLNYMNLATARSIRRAREVGLRKVVGSQRRTLIFQFLAESVTITLISLILALILAALLMPFFNQLAGKSFELTVLFSPLLLFSILGIIILVGVVGGSYPAFYLSGFNPVRVMKGEIRTGRSGITLRKTLVVLQFTISIAMIICTLVVYQQLNHLRKMDVGYDMTNIVTLELPSGAMIDKYPVLKQNLLNDPNIIRVTSTNTAMGEGSPKVLFSMETADGMDERGINFAVVDHDFVETMGIRMLEGRDFSDQTPSDTLQSVVVNQALAQRMNWKDPIGKQVILGEGERIRASVIGVMQDYHQTGMYNEMESLMLVYRTNNRIVYTKIQGDQTSRALEHIEKTWKEIFPRQPFEYNFLEDMFMDQFGSDKKRAVIFTSFTILAIIIACLGLFGLASYTVDQRVKEIGIRKVMGATEGVIVTMISREFMILILISMAVSFPLAWYFMNDWLQNYVYRIDLNIFVFLISGLLSLVITLLTISNQAYKASLIDPANSLRVE